MRLYIVSGILKKSGGTLHNFCAWRIANSADEALGMVMNEYRKDGHTIRDYLLSEPSDNMILQAASLITPPKPKETNLAEEV